MSIPHSSEDFPALFDKRLARLIHADDAEIDGEVERLLADAQPLVARILSRYPAVLVSPEDTEDLASTIRLRLILKLREIHRTQDASIENFPGYVSTLAYNVVNGHLRKRFPERAALKLRLRHVLSRDPRFAIWVSGAGSVCGLAVWKGLDDIAHALPEQSGSMLQAVARGDTARALEQLFRMTQRPVLFEVAVDAVANAWDVVDGKPIPLEDSHAEPAGATRVEDIEFTRMLWSEILELPPMQRKALLLNLRYTGETNIISLLVLGGIARFDDIAAALEMSRNDLAKIWKTLPLEDSILAERFGITRQQVINLRRAARERLSRRLHR